MPVSLTILVGTMTGTAELVAEEIGDMLEDGGHSVAIEPMDDLDASVLAAGGDFLICVSTYGQGDVPDNATRFFADLQESRPDLSGVRYGLFSLGDRTYLDTFNFGGKRFDELLASLGAARVGEIAMHDASAGTVPEEDGVEWARAWIAEFEALAAA